MLLMENQRGRFSKHFSTRDVIKSHRVSFDQFLHKYAFQCEELLLLYKKLIELNMEYSRTVVKAFYSDLKFDSKRAKYTVMVRGVHIFFDEADLCDIFGLPANDGIMLTEIQTEDQIAGENNGFSFDQLWNILAAADEPQPADRRIRPAHLSVNYRVLHYIVARVFFNKSGSYAYCNADELKTLVLLVQKKTINVANLILQKMHRCSKLGKASLPYASIISAILQHNHIHHLEASEKESPDQMTETTLHRMHLHLVDNRWVSKHDDRHEKRIDEVRKGKRKRNAGDGDEDHHPTPEDSHTSEPTKGGHRKGEASKDNGYQSFIKALTDMEDRLMKEFDVHQKNIVNLGHVVCDVVERYIDLKIMVDDIRAYIKGAPSSSALARDNTEDGSSPSQHAGRDNTEDGSSPSQHAAEDKTPASEQVDDMVKDTQPPAIEKQQPDHQGTQSTPVDPGVGDFAAMFATDDVGGERASTSQGMELVVLDTPDVAAEDAVEIGFQPNTAAGDATSPKPLSTIKPPLDVAIAVANKIIEEYSSPVSLD